MIDPSQKIIPITDAGKVWFVAETEVKPTPLESSLKNIESKLDSVLDQIRNWQPSKQE